MTAISVSQLNRYVKSLLDGDGHLKTLLLSGEISNFVNHYQSGHLYMTLKDEGAAVKAVMFRSQAVYLKFRPENGMKVIVRARVSLYEKDGSFQLYIDEMQPDGAGALQIAYEQMKRRLEAEGLFDEGRKLPIPSFPSCVGVITSPTGAAVRDIVNVLGRRFPAAKILLYPALVQGEGAPGSLKSGVSRFQTMREQKDPDAPDVIIIGRGGGSLEELWAFNDEGLAREIAACSIPIISAVGHETDFTICDFVADLRAPTPSAAAELAVPDKEELMLRLRQLSERSATALRTGVLRKKQQLQALQGRPCLSAPLYYVHDRALRLDYVTRSFASAAEAVVSRNRHRLSTLAGKLDAMSPLRVIARGYAVVTCEQAVVSSVEQVNVGDSVSLHFRDGMVQCRVEEKNSGEESKL